MAARRDPRRVLQAGFLGLLAVLALLPLLAQMAGWNAWRGEENRAQAAMPAAPQDLAALRAWPRGVDAALNDRLGLRAELLRLRDQALFRLFGAFASPRVLAGPGGRVFLAGDEAAPLIRFACGRGPHAQTLPELVAGTETLLRRLQARVPRAEILLAPSAPVLYPAELPPALRRDCAAGVPFGRQLIARLPPEWRGHLLFPQAELTEPGLAGPAIPRRFLHWDAVGAGRAVTAWAEEKQGRRPTREVPAASHWRASDLSGFFPGLRLGSMVLEPAVEIPGLEVCLGHPCFPGFADVARVLVDVRRFRAVPPAPGRLLVLSDSFGAAIAPWLARHDGEVWQLTMNHLDHVAPGDRRRLAQALFEGYRPDQVLVVMLDASIRLMLPRLLELLE